MWNLFSNCSYLNLRGSRGDLGGLNFTVVFASQILTRDYNTRIYSTFSYLDFPHELRRMRHQKIVY
jgi:hypothetical protein